MAKCDSCGKTILFGGEKQGNLRFCSDKCLHNGIIAASAQDLPASAVEDELRALHGSNCPQCGGAGPIDLHFYHQVWSALYLTSHKSAPLLACLKCGRKKQVFSAFFSFFLGWWGFPWGLFYTPIQVFRNIKALLKPLDPSVASPELREMVKFNLAQQIVSAHNAATLPAPIASPFGDAAPSSNRPPLPSKSAKAAPSDPFSNQDAFKS